MLRCDVIYAHKICGAYFMLGLCKWQWAFLFPRSLLFIPQHFFVVFKGALKNLTKLLKALPSFWNSRRWNKNEIKWINYSVWKVLLNYVFCCNLQNWNGKWFAFLVKYLRVLLKWIWDCLFHFLVVICWNRKEWFFYETNFAFYSTNFAWTLFTKNAKNHLSIFNNNNSKKFEGQRNYLSCYRAASNVGV